ncbi:MAG: hypothetical protein CMO74_09185 [Verrucomicrobiales bacterium]|nr:hypothetical protein [Verrucomicrobiales bacterium]|tara:strand:- start:2 stop:754 length:753 start_codon:yes stop_codon:yes gene_type:complete
MTYKRDKIRFEELAVLRLSGRETPGQSEELDALIMKHPELGEEMESLEKDAALAREVLPLIEATRDKAPEEPPAWVYHEVHREIDRTFGPRKTKPESDGLPLLWRFAIGVGAAVILAAVLVPQQPSPAGSGPTAANVDPAKPIVELAVRDFIGTTRSPGKPDPIETFQAAWPEAQLSVFETRDEWQGWLQKPAANKAVIRIGYDRIEHVIQLRCWSKDKQLLHEDWVVENGLSEALKKVSVKVESWVEND